MTPDERARLEYLEGILSRFMLQDRLYSEKNFQLADGRNIIVGGGTGTTIGQSTSKLALYGVTPVVRASAIAAPSIPGAAYSQGTAQDAVDKINAIRTAIKNVGITA